MLQRSTSREEAVAARGDKPFNRPMQVMVQVSLLLNLAVLVPVCLGLLFAPPWAERGFGEATPARRILLAIYAAIAVASVLLLAIRDPRQVAVLLLVQVIYKVLTPFTVGSSANPVVLSNLGVTAVHLVTLVMIWRVVGNPFAREKAV